MNGKSEIAVESSRRPCEDGDVTTVNERFGGTVKILASTLRRSLPFRRAGDSDVNQ